MAARFTILIVDDEEDFAHFVKLNLEGTGKFDVIISTSGQEGLEMAREVLPDLILLDILMPDIQGTDVAEDLLADSRTQNIPMIYLTAVATKKDVSDRDGVIGGRQFIAKPVSPDELIAAIERILQPPQ